MADLPYAAIRLDLLDRATGEIKPMMVYPVTRAVLVSADCSRESWFEPNPEGHWEQLELAGEVKVHG